MTDTRNVALFMALLVPGILGRAAEIRSGNIDYAGEQDAYSFQLSSPGRYYFDSLTNNGSIHWSLSGPPGDVMVNRAFSSSDADNQGTPILNLPTGNYSLTVSANNSVTGGYAFRLLDLATAPLITPGSVVSNADLLSLSSDIYQFAAQAGDLFTFDALSVTGSPATYWRLVDPYGHIIFANYFTDVNSLQLQATGNYLLLVEGRIAGSPTGYSFQLNLLGNTPPAAFTGTPLTMGLGLTNVLTTAGETNAYTFTLAQPSRLYYDSLTNNNSLRYTLFGPGGTVASIRGVSGGANNDLHEAPAGDYQLVISAVNNYAGSYAFRLLDLSTATPITPGTVIEGTNAPTRGLTAYRFNATPGTRLYFDTLARSGYTYYGNAFWTLIDPYGNVQFADNGFNDRATTTLTGDGIYTLWVAGGDAEPGDQGTYSFNLVPAVTGTTALSLNTVIDGSINTPGAQQLYTFNLNSARRVHFQTLTNQPSVKWTMSGPEGVVQAGVAFNSSGWFNYTLPAGDYTITAYADGDATGGYRFELQDFAIASPIAVGDTVNGTVTPAGSINFYDLPLTAGDRLYIDALSQSGFTYYGNCFWRLEDPEGNVVFLPDINVSFDRGFGDIGPFTVQRTATYHLMIGGNVRETQDSANYSFRFLPVNDSSQTITLGQVTDATIGSPGEQRVYTFALNAPARISMDNLMNVPGLRWTLAGVDRTHANNVNFSGDAWYIYDLNPGTYTFTVNAPADTTGTAHFRLLNLGSAQPFAIGDVVNLTCTPASENVVTSFNGTAGQRVYFDSLNQTGFTYYGYPFWLLLDADGNTIFDAGMADRGPLFLPSSGTYTLLLRGHINEPQTAGNVSFRINDAPLTTTPLVLDTLTSGDLAVPGELDRFTFTVTQPTPVVFDSRTNTTLRWTLSGQTGNLIGNRPFNSSDGANFDSFQILPAGTYNLDVTGATDATGGYAFALRTLASGDVLTLGGTVNNTLDPANVTRLYQFSASAGDRVQFQALSQNGMPSAYWRLRDPMGDLVWGGYFNASTHSNLLERTGTYTLQLEGSYNDTGTGSFSFSSTSFTPTPPPPPGGTVIAFDQIVSNTLPTAATVDSYLLTLTQPGHIYLDQLRPMDNVIWSLIGSSGPIIKNQYSQNGLTPPLVSRLFPAGNYEFQFTGVAAAYSFRILNASTAPVYTLGSVVTNYVSPSSGAALYRVNLNTNSSLYFDLQSESGFNSSSWKRLWGPAGEQLFFITGASDSGTFSPMENGEHFLSFDGPWQNTNPTGIVSFALNPITYSTNTLTFGTTVSGTLDPTGGAVDTYSFTLTETNRVFFDVLNTSSFNWNWSLSGPYGDVVVNRGPLNSDGIDQGDSSLALLPGDYQLRITSTTTQPSPYSFRLLRATDATPFTLGDTVTTNSAPASSTTLYRFNGTAGQLLYYDALAQTGFAQSLALRLYSPAGNIIQSQYFNSDADTFALPSTGEYLLSIEGRVYDANASGTVTFNYRPVTHVNHALALDAIATDTFSVPGVRHTWQFSLAAPQELWFDALTNTTGATWTLSRADNVLVSSRGFLGSDGLDIGNSLLDLPAGDYTITIALGLNNTGTYAFRLVSPASATPMFPDTDVAVLLDPPMTTRLLTFNGTAGDQYYFDGRALTGSGNVTARLYAPDGTMLFSRYSTDDEPTFALPFTGTYLLALEGRIYNGSGPVTANFALITNPSKPVDPLFQNTTLPDLVVLSPTVSPATGLKSGDAFTLSWIDRNTGQLATSGQFTDRVTVRNTDLNQVIINTTLPYVPGDAGNGPIDPATQRSRQLALTLPAGAAGAGHFSVTVTADSLNQIAEYNAGGTGEANNSASTTFSSSLAAYPDLQVIDLAAVPATGWSAGSIVQFSWAVTNTGPATATGSWVDRVIVRNASRSTVLLTTNVVHDANLDGNLPAGGRRNRSAQFIVPAGLNGTGIFEISVETDALAQIVEAQSDGSGEDNNVTMITVRSAPDLQIGTVSATPSPAAQSGANLAISWTVNNAGSGPVETSFSDRVKVTNLDTGGTLIDTPSGYNPASAGNGAILPGTTRNRSINVKLPDGPTAVGHLQIEVSADTYNQVFELTASGSGESNNVGSTTLNTTLAPYPDLLASNVVVTPSTPQSGQEITVRWDDLNQGTAPATGNWYDRIVIENTSSLAVLLDTTLYRNTASLGALTNGTTQLRQYTFRLPNGLSGSGPLRATITADGLNSIYEYNGSGTGESNNVASANFTSSLALYPDLEVAAFNVTPATFQSGNQITASWTITNAGNATITGDFYDRILVRNLSLGTTLADRSYYLNPVADANGPIAPGQIRQRSASLNLPDGPAGAGNIEVALFLDSGNRVFEYRDGVDAEANNNTNITRVSTVALYPDLAVSNVTAPSSGLPGQSLDMSWTVANNGAAPTPSSWTDQVFLVDDANPNAPQLLGSFPFANALSVGSSSNVTRTVTLPFFTVGTRRLAVRANAGQTFYEPDFNNNFATAANTITLAPRLELTLNRSSAPESGGSSIVQVTVLRNGNTSAELAVSLASSDTGSATITGTVTIPAGQTYQSTYVTLLNNNLVDGNRTVTFTATAAGYSPASDNLLVQDDDLPTLTLQTSSGSVTEDAGPAALVGYLSRNTSTNAPLTVTVVSDSPTQLLPPATVIIPAGQFSVAFDIDAPLNTTIEGPRNVRLQASATGFQTGSALVAVADNDAPMITLALAADAVVEGADSPATTGKVVRQPPLTSPLNVVLSQSIPGLLLLPPELDFAAGEADVDFNINVNDDNLVNGTRTNIIAARVRGVLGVPIDNGEATAQLLVYDNDGPSLTLTLASDVVSENGTITGTLSRNTGFASALDVNLSSSDTTESQPASPVVTIPKNAASVTVTINGLPDGINDGIQPTIITAEAPGFNSATARLNVTDIDLPDLAVGDIIVPSSGQINARANVTYTVSNTGPVPATGSWVDRVFISADNQLGGDTLAGAVTNVTSLASNSAYTRTVSITLPANPGTYHVIVVTDAGNSVVEGSERNNVISIATVDVQPDYRATVETAIVTAPCGTPIPITGRAFNPDDNSPARLKQVTVRVLRGATRRVYSVFTDLDGTFQMTFTPLPNETGDYQLAADHPLVNTDTPQDSFSLLGFGVSAEYANVTIVPETLVTGQITIQNATSVQLTGIKAAAPDAPASLGLQLNVPTTLDGNASVVLDWSLNTTITNAARVVFPVTISSTEGCSKQVLFTVNIAPLRPQLVAEPSYLDRGMVRGEQTLVSFKVRNIGGVPTGLLDVLPPDVSWISIAGATQLDSIEPGDSTTVNVLLAPPADLPLNLFTGNLSIGNSRVALSVPFRFRSMSTAQGDLVITATDDYTYYVADSPKVEGAKVTVTDPFTGQVVTNGVTDAAGEARFTGLMEGAYVVDVTATKHNNFRGTATIKPGVETALEAFMLRQTVSYQWTVVPVDVPDRYKIQLQSVFETEVPIPNVIVEEPYIMPIVFQGETNQFDITLRNEGLIAAQNVEIIVPDDPNYIIEPLVRKIGTIPAKSRLTIPVSISARTTTVGSFQLPNILGSPHILGGSCELDTAPCLPKIPLGVNYYYVCGPNGVLQQRSIDLSPVCLAKDVKDCIENALTSAASLHEFRNGGNAANFACDIIQAILQCAGVNLSPCQKAALSIACGALTGGAAGAAGGAASGDTLECICGLIKDLNISIPSAPPNYGTVNYVDSPIIGSNHSGFNGYPWGVGYTIGGGSCSSPSASGGGASGSFSAAPHIAAEGVCARVRIQIDQEAVMTRVAFQGSLEIDNNVSTPITGIRVDLDVRDGAGNPAGDCFVVTPPVVTGMGAVDGTGTVAGLGIGTAEYLFRPTRDAAPTAPEVYRIGGTLRYIDNGQEVVVPLLSSTITVYPEARLELHYFQQRDVYADDPFTDEIEPSEPFALGLLARNIGAGTARNFQITSAQPKIIDNQKGLLIDFKIIGSQVGTNAAEPSLTVNLGNIAPGQSQVAEWLMTSTLQGKFIEYNATFEHVDNFGSTNLSLIDSVQIHELIKPVMADRPGDDLAPDFLANDIPDPDSLPDVLYFSDGTTELVNSSTNGTFSNPVGAGARQTTLTFTPQTGWFYVTLPDPGPTWRLYRVVRSDNKQLLVGTNTWTTDRTFPSAISGVVREHRFHLLDYNSTGSYTLFYRPIDTVPPVLVSVGPVTPSLQTTAVDSVEEVFSKEIDISTFDLADVQLSRDGGPNLINAGITFNQTATNRVTLSGLAPFTGNDGNYELTFNAAGIQDFAGNNGANSLSTTWAKGTIAPVIIALGPVVPDPRNTPVDTIEVVFSRAIDSATFTRDDLQLKRNSGANLIDPGVAISALDTNRFLISGLTALTQTAGDYAFSIIATGLTDTIGTPGAGIRTETWSMVTTGPQIASLEQPATNPRNIVVPSLDVTFAAPIDPSTLSWQDLSLTRDGGPNLITSAVTVTQVSPTVYRLANFNWVVGQEGTYQFTVNAADILDAAGNAGTGAASVTWKMDTTAPLAATALAVSPDLGVSNTDGLINTLTPALTGSLAETNLTVRVKDLSSGADLGTAIVNGMNFSKPLALVTAGSHKLQIDTVDAAGNVAFPPATLDLFVDLTQPSAEINPVIPALQNAAVSSLAVTFSEAINGPTFSREDLTLRRQGGANLINALVKVTNVSSNQYQITGLNLLTDAAGNYELALNMATVEDRAGNAGTNVVAVTWARTGANQPPSLAAIADRSAKVGELITFTNIASDPDPGQKLTFSMNVDAPANARLGETNGVFAWTPTRSQSPGVYSITITATDDGVPAAAASRTFVVGVEDYTETALGETALLAGENGSLNLTLISTTGLTNLVAEVAVPTNRLTSPQIGNLSALVSRSTMQELGNGRYRVSLTSQPGQSIRGSNVLANLQFGSVVTPPSAFIKLPLSNIAARQPDGSVVGTTFVRDGRVALIVDQPLLELLRATPNLNLRVFGRPGDAYDLQTSATLSGPWSKAERLRLHGLETQLDLFKDSAATSFYRLASVDVSSPFFELVGSDSSGVDIAFYAERGLTFDLQTNNDLNLPWSTLQTQSMTNQFQEIHLDTGSADAQFLRAHSR